jgi:hypothetical protein
VKQFSELRESLVEAKELTYTVVHAKKGKVVVTAPTSYDAAQKAAKKWKLKSTGGVDAYLMKESVELDEAYQQFLDKSPSNWGEEKVVAYGTKKGYKVIGVCGHGRVDGIVLFGLDAGDKSYVGKEAKVKTGQTVFRYATRNSMAGDIFPLVKIDVKKGLLYNLSQKSSDGEVDYAEFESKGIKLRYLRLAATANLRDITGFDPGFGSMKESVEEGKKPVSQMTPAEKAADAKRRKDYNAFQKSKRNESVDLEEGRMKEFHGYIDQGKSAQWIAKKMGLDMKTVKALMDDIKESTDLSEAKDDDYRRLTHAIKTTPKHRRDKVAMASQPAKTDLKAVARRKAIEKHQERMRAKKDSY